RRGCGCAAPSRRGGRGTSARWRATQGSRGASKRRTTTRRNGRSKRRNRPLAMPRGDSPQKAQEFYKYLLAHHETEHPVKTWHVNWLSLAWMWGFVAALSLILILWIWQYRTTRQK